MFTYFALPDATTIIASSSEWFNPFFEEFSVVIYAMIGLGVLGAIIGYLIKRK